MNIKQEFGGAIQSLLVLLRVNGCIAIIKSNVIHMGPIVLIALLFTCMEGISLAQMSQNSLELDNSRGINASSESSTIYWLEALPECMPMENSDQLFHISGSLGNIKNAIHVSGDESSAHRQATVSDMDKPEPPKGDIVIGLFSGRGFALKDNETHVLRMIVELIKDVDPVYLMDLMTSNKSIEDIKEELRAKEGATSLRGSLRINESSYSLLNIKLMPSGDNANATAVDADVAMLYLKPAPGMIMKPDSSDKTAIAGHIKVIVAPSEGGLVGKGELIMSRDEYNGKYIVLLHMEKPIPYDSLPPRDSINPPSK